MYMKPGPRQYPKPRIAGGKLADTPCVSKTIIDRRCAGATDEYRAEMDVIGNFLKE
jgi:hypothetical protein